MGTRGKVLSLKISFTSTRCTEDPEDRSRVVRDEDVFGDTHVSRRPTTLHPTRVQPQIKPPPLERFIEWISNVEEGSTWVLRTVPGLELPSRSLDPTFEKGEAHSVGVAPCLPVRMPRRRNPNYVNPTLQVLQVSRRHPGSETYSVSLR